MLAPGHQQGFEVQLGAQRLATGDQRGLVRTGADHRLELGQVGFDDGGAAITGKVRALRIDHHRNAPRPRRGDQGRHVGQGALGVIGQHQHVHAVEMRSEGGADARRVTGIERLLEIQANQLLVAGDDAQLGNRWRVAQTFEGAFHALGKQAFFQQATGFILADQTDDPRLRAEGGGVEGHVAGPAGAHLVVLHLHHRHRRLGRDAGRGPVPVTVEHHIAADEHTAGGKVRQGKMHAQSDARTAGRQRK